MNLNGKVSRARSDSGSTAFRQRELVVMHLHEAARLAGQMRGQIDMQLFAHLIGMALYAALEGDENESRTAPLHS